MNYSTKQRTVVGKVIEDAKRPLTPSEILSKGRKKSLSLGMATVYRALRFLIDEGRAVLVEIPGEPPRYESSGRGHHHHFVCNSCRKVFDLEGCLCHVDALAPSSFRVESHEIILYGSCDHCSGV